MLQLFRQFNLVLVDPLFSLPQAKSQVSLPLFEVVDQIIFLEDHFLDLGLSMCEFLSDSPELFPEGAIPKLSFFDGVIVFSLQVRVPFPNNSELPFSVLERPLHNFLFGERTLQL